MAHRKSTWHIGNLCRDRDDWYGYAREEKRHGSISAAMGSRINEAIQKAWDNGYYAPVTISPNMFQQRLRFNDHGWDAFHMVKMPPVEAFSLLCGQYGLSCAGFLDDDLPTARLGIDVQLHDRLGKIYALSASQATWAAWDVMAEEQGPGRGIKIPVAFHVPAGEFGTIAHVIADLSCYMGGKLQNGKGQPVSIAPRPFLKACEEKAEELQRQYMMKVFDAYFYDFNAAGNPANQCRVADANLRLRSDAIADKGGYFNVSKLPRGSGSDCLVRASNFAIREYHRKIAERSVNALDWLPEGEKQRIGMLTADDVYYMLDDLRIQGQVAFSNADSMRLAGLPVSAIEELLRGLDKIQVVGHTACRTAYDFAERRKRTDLCKIDAFATAQYGDAVGTLCQAYTREQWDAFLSSRGVDGTSTLMDFIKKLVSPIFNNECENFPWVGERFEGQLARQRRNIVDAYNLAMAAGDSLCSEEERAEYGRGRI